MTPDQLAQELAKAGQVGMALADVRRGKALALVVRKARVSDAAGNPVPAVGIGVGEFLNAIVQFVIVAFAIFMLVKAINRISRREAPPPPGPTEEVLLLREIRDSLKR